MFKLKTVIGLSKCHFKKSDNIFNDLATAFFLDGYDTAFLFSEQELAEMLLRKFMNSNILNEKNYSDFILDLHSDRCYRYGYRVEGKEYNFFTAIVNNILSHLSVTDLSDLGWEEWPNYKHKVEMYNYVRQNKKY